MIHCLQWVECSPAAERCNPLWEVACADDLAVAIHGSFGSKMKIFSSDRYLGNVFYDHMIAHPFGQMAVVMDMIAGGVMDRHSTLRVGFFESGLGWIPYWLDRLDEHFEVMGHHTPWLKRRPSNRNLPLCAPRSGTRLRTVPRTPCAN